MNISVLIPCHNEEESIQACVQSCLDQTRVPDQILVVNDGSTDRSGEILAQFGDKIQVLTLPVATGNKSYAQQHGLKYITGDIFVATDGDTVLSPGTIEAFERAYKEQPDIAAACGYVKGLKYNWLTACREIEYVIGQNLFKIAQAHLDAIFVIPGCSGAFHTKTFLKYITFDHDTITEDLDFTYKLHELGFRIAYVRDAIAYTQDPETLPSYINQMRRWYSGGWQNLRKHHSILKKSKNIFQISLNYIEGFVFSSVLFVAPILNIRFFEYFIIPFLTIILLMGGYAAYARKRWDLLYFAPTYITLVYISAYVFLEQFFREIVLKNNNLVWFQPARRKINL